MAQTIIISLDINGAFDNVDHEQLMHKMLNELEPDSIQYCFGDFLLRRRIFIRYNNIYSQQRELCKWVPQGSPLGPILWNFFINKLDDEMNNNSQNDETEMQMYADNVFIIHNDAPSQRLQQQID